MQPMSTSGGISGDDWSRSLSRLSHSFLGWMLGQVVFIYVVGYLTLFLIRGIYLALTGLCRANDSHPLFSAVLSPLLATALAVIGLVQGPGPETHTPPATVALVLQWAGPVTLTVLSYLEIRALRRLAGSRFPFRDGPGTWHV
jgi:hypothetical protein